MQGIILKECVHLSYRECNLADIPMKITEGFVKECFRRTNRRNTRTKRFLAIKTYIQNLLQEKLKKC